MDHVSHFKSKTGKKEEILKCTLTSSINPVNVYVKMGGTNSIKAKCHKSLQQVCSYTSFKSLSEASGFKWELVQYTENVSILHQFV